MSSRLKGRTESFGMPRSPVLKMGSTTAGSEEPVPLTLLETRGSAIPSFHINAFILKATLKAEWTENDTLATNTDNNVHKDAHKDVHKEISERQSLIISMIQDNPALGRIEMSTKLGVNEKTIRRDLDDLKEKGIIVRIGGRKEGHWEINKNK